MENIIFGSVFQAPSTVLGFFSEMGRLCKGTLTQIELSQIEAYPLSCGTQEEKVSLTRQKGASFCMLPVILRKLCHIICGALVILV